MIPDALEASLLGLRFLAGRFDGVVEEVVAGGLSMNRQGSYERNKLDTAIGSLKRAARPELAALQHGKIAYLHLVLLARFSALLVQFDWSKVRPEASHPCCSFKKKSHKVAGTESRRCQAHTDFLRSLQRGRIGDRHLDKLEKEAENSFQSWSTS